MRNTIIRSSSFLKLKMILKRYTLFIFIAFFLLFSSQTLAQLTEDANGYTEVDIRASILSRYKLWSRNIPDDILFIYLYPPIIEEARIILSWNSYNADYCLAFGSWSGLKPVNGVEYLVLRKEGAYLYGLMCINVPSISEVRLYIGNEGNILDDKLFDFYAEDHVFVVLTSENLEDREPSIDLKINNSDGPVYVQVPTTLKISYSFNPGSFLMGMRYRDFTSPLKCNIIGSDNLRFYIKTTKKAISSSTTALLRIPGKHTYTFSCDIPGPFDLHILSDSVEVIATPIPQSINKPDLAVFDINFFMYSDESGCHGYGEILGEILPSSLVKYIGQQVCVKAILSNIGRSDTPSNFNVKWFLNGKEVGYRGHSVLRSGQTSGDEVGFLWRVEPGDYEFTFVADVDNHIRETDENNNSRSIRVRVDLPIE